jgi:hypothetical protein
MLRSGVWSLLGASTFFYLAAACGSSSSGSKVDAGSAGTANGSGTGPDLGNVGNGGSNATSGGSTGNGETCAANLVEAKRVPLDMYVMLDVSGSMLEVTEGDASVTKWQAVSSALTAFVTDDASAGIGVGLQVFPILQKDAPARCTSDTQCGAYGPCINRACWPLANGVVSNCFDADDCNFNQNCVVLGECAQDTNYVCNADATTACSGALGACVVPESICVSLTDCRSETYATPAAPIAELPGAGAALVDVISGSMPDEGGLTPSGPALQGAIEQAKIWAAAHPERQVVAVLATDGLPTLQAGSPTTCEPVRYVEDIDAVVGLATSGRVSEPSVSTFVIGVVGPDDTAAPTILDRIARAGGSTEAFIVDTAGDVQSEFRAALDTIRASGLTCDLAVPQEDAGKSVDYAKVNVEFTNEAGTKQELFRVEGAEGCADAPSGQGWYYDTDPKQAAPSRISVCPTVCSEFQKTDMGSVNIALGCESRVVVK